jgi:predicted HTH transcriptional regulator
VIIPVLVENTSKETGSLAKDDFTSDFTDDNSRLKQIIFQISQNNKISMRELAVKLGVTKRTIASDIALLRSEGVIERIGNNKTGLWIIKK